MELTLDPPFPNPLPHSRLLGLIAFFGRSPKCLLDADHQVVACSDAEWQRWLLDDPDTHVGRDQVGPVLVSTVFLHCNQSGLGGLFETRVFGGQFDDCHWKHDTWAGAELGHKAAVELVRMALRTGLPLKSEPETP